MLKWYEQECEKEQNIIASRVRFARNWNEYVFPSRLSEKDGREMVRRLDEGLTDLSEIDGRYYEAVMLEDLDELERQVLADRRVINRASIKKKGPAELILSAQEDISVLLNYFEINHSREGELPQHRFFTTANAKSFAEIAERQELVSPSTR